MNRLRLSAVVIALLLAGVFQPARADELKGSSLDFVPADVSFYYSARNGREVFDRVVESNAFAKIQQSPMWAFGMLMWQAEASDPDTEIGKFMEEWRKPENQELTELAIDMASTEVFVYGDENLTKLYALSNEFNRMLWSEMGKEIASGDFFDFEPGREPLQGLEGKIVDLLSNKLDKIDVPTLVTGARITDPAAAKRQLIRLEEILRAEGAPEGLTVTNFGWEEIGSGEYLVVDVHGIEPSGEEDDDLPAEFRKKIEKRLKELKFSLAIGIDRGFVLASIGPSKEHLAKLGQGELLVDQEEFARVREAGEMPLTHIAYTSAELIEEAMFGPRSVESWSDFIKAFVASEEIPIYTEIREMWLVGIAEVSTGIKEWFPERGPRMSFSWLSDRGWEGYSYDWDENIAYNGDDRLSMLDHLGKDPVFFWLTRHKYRPESYDPLFKFGYLILDTVEQVAVEFLDDEDLPTFQLWVAEGRPLLDRAVKLYREEYSAGLADGQAAWVIDAQQTRTDWGEELPEPTEPLPLPEFGIVQGVSDADKLRRARREGIAILREAVDLAKKLGWEEDSELPFKVPEQVLHSTEHGEILFVANPEMPDAVGNATGLSETTMVTAQTVAYATQLLKPTPLKIEGPILEHDGPAFGAMYLNWGKLIDKATPWIEYAAQIAAEEDEEEKAIGGEANDINEFDPLDGIVPEVDPATLAQIQMAIDWLKCFQQYSSISYMEGEAQVTHYEWRIQDLP